MITLPLPVLILLVIFALPFVLLSVLLGCFMLQEKLRKAREERSIQLYLNKERIDR